MITISWAAMLLAAYLLGSIPTAVVIGRRMGHLDIRTVGDGNAGARNTSHVLGWRAGIIVAIVDFFKGLAAVLLSHALGFGPVGQTAAAFAAALGHDFPVFAGFQGGQGLAVTIGAMIGLAPLDMGIGLAVYGLLYLLFRNSDLGAGAGIGLAVLLFGIGGAPVPLLIAVIGLILLIPLKKIIDTPRRRRAQQAAPCPEEKRC
jgi:glycerol-3-phosphate acyltransferase PlsY